MATSYYLIDHPNEAWPQYGYPRRNGADLTGAVVLHDAENVTDLKGKDYGAENVAEYLTHRDSWGSYHEIVDRDSVVELAPYEYETWHDTTSNNYAIGLCVAWRKADLPRMSRRQRESYYRPFARSVLRAVKWLKAKRGITVPLDEFKSRRHIVKRRPGLTTHSRMDPGRRSDPFGTGSKYETEFLAVLAEEAGSKPPAPTKPAKPDREWPDVPLPITRHHTAESHAAWVELLATVGYRASDLTVNFQRWLKDLKDDDGQPYYSGRIDGHFGPYTIDALQHKLHDDGLYDGVFDAFTAPYDVARGPLMIGGEIRYLNDQRQYL